MHSSRSADPYDWETGNDHRQSAFQLAQQCHRLSRQRHIMRLACQLLDALAEFALFQFLERDRPKRSVRVELIPLGLGHGARANEGQRKQVERLAHKVALSSRIAGDIAQQLSERLGPGDRRPR